MPATPVRGPAIPVAGQATPTKYRSIEARHNHIVLAVLNNEFTVKRLHRRGGQIKLLAENPLYPCLILKNDEELSIWGVVTFNLHKLC